MKRIYNVAIVAACDRYNYGDVLLPIIFEMFMKQNYKEVYDACCIDYVAQIESNLEGVGGNKTKAIYNLDSKYDYIIVAGGEMITTPYTASYIHLQQNLMIVNIFKMMTKVSWRVSDCISKALMHGKNVMPWIIYPTSEKQGVVYISVGGVGFNYLNKKQVEGWRKCIQTSRNFSVRDETTYRLISEKIANEKCTLLPDMAIIMSQLFKKEDLSKKICTNKVKNIVDIKEYYVIQVNFKMGKNLLKMLAESINEIYKSSGKKCILLTIGRCAGHDDIIPLQELHNICVKDATILIAEGTIYEIMYVISQSRAFAGTSLHGIITAASFGVPHTVLSENNKKVLSFVKTWETTSVKLVNTSKQLVDFVMDSQIGNTVNAEKINEMMELVNKNLNTIVRNLHF